MVFAACHLVSQGLDCFTHPRSENQNTPEGDWLIAVLEETVGPPLKVQCAGRIGDLGANVLDYALRVRLRGVLALEDSLDIDVGHVHGGCWVRSCRGGDLARGRSKSRGRGS